MIDKKIIVIGSGLAGALICNELTKYTNVTLLEAGLKDSVQYPHINFTQKNFGAVKTFCIGGGGTTNLWHNGLVPLKIDDIHSAEFKRVLMEAEPYMDRAASNLYFKDKSYSEQHDTVLSEMNRLTNKLGLFSDGLDCLLYPKKYKRLDVDSKVNAFYAVGDIKFIKNNSKIKSITFSVGAKQHTLKTDIVIICAGTLGTPSIVQGLLSDSGHCLKKIGRGLADHPMGFAGKVKIKRKFATLFRKLSSYEKGSYISRTAVRLQSDCGKYTGCAFFRPALTMHNNLSIYKYKSSLGASKGAERFRRAFSAKIMHPDILAEIYAHIFGHNIRSRIYNILLIFEQKRGKSRVRYSDSGVKVDWFITEEEMAIYNSMTSKLRRMLHEIADELVIKSPLPDEWLWSAAHHSGTIALGNNADDIVDENLKIRKYDNVFICDGSIIQEHSYANTGLTIGQLAFRLTDHVLSKVKE